MENSQLFIPSKIRVGFQERDDTYTKKLAYVVYFDSKGVLRKEKSFESWRDKKIKAIDFDNKPQSGLILNREIKRYNWSHFSSKRTMIRVFDPREIEFEITTENLIGVLMNSDCSKRGLSGEYVFAWSGPELVLLPTSSEEYQKATTYTDLQSQKVSSKDLVAGCSYKTKKEEDLIYIGRFPWFAFNSFYSDKENNRQGKKYHIFYAPLPKNLEEYQIKYHNYFILKTNLEFLAIKNSDEVVNDFAAIIEEFQNNIHSSNISRFELVPVEVCDKINKNPTYSYYVEQLLKTNYFTLNSNILTEKHLAIENEYESASSLNGNEGKYVKKGYNLTNGHSINIDNLTQVKTVKEKINYNYYRQSEHITYQLDDLKKFNLCDLYVHFENGKKVKVENLSNL